MSAIFTRRSIRKYTSEDITEEELDYILKAAMAAPSAGNEKPWHFVIINDRKILKKVPEFHPYAKMLNEALVAILVCSDLNLKKYEQDYWIQDCSAASENILIAAKEQGLGSVWLGIYPLEERIKGIKKLVNMPENIVPFSLIPIGHPAETKAPKDEFDKERIHYNVWS